MTDLSLPALREAVAKFDGLRLAVQFRSNRDELGLLAMMTGISKATLARP